MHVEEHRCLGVAFVAPAPDLLLGQRVGRRLGLPAEDPPHGQWGILNGGTGGGYLQSFIAGGTPGAVRATWEDMKFLKFEPVPATASTWGKVKDTYR